MVLQNISSISDIERNNYIDLDNNKEKSSIDTYELIEMILDYKINYYLKALGYNKDKTTNEILKDIDELIKSKILIGDNYYFIRKITQKINKIYEYQPLSYVKDIIKNQYKVNKDILNILF